MAKPSGHRVLVKFQAIENRAFYFLDIDILTTMSNVNNVMLACQTAENLAIKMVRHLTSSIKKIDVEAWSSQHTLL